MGKLSTDHLILGQSGLARALYDTVADLPIISPHGHCDPEWFATNAPFSDPAHLLIVPDHYVLRMLVSQGVRLEDMGVARLDGGPVETDPRMIWARFAEHYHLFAGTPTRAWLDYTFETLFGLEEPLNPSTATAYYDRIAACLADNVFRPRALFDRFKIEVLATTEGTLDPLTHHKAIAESDWPGRVITTYRPDQVTDPDYEGFAGALDQLAEITGGETESWAGYLEAHRLRRAYFRDHGATATDHGHPTAETADLSQADAAALYDRLRAGRAEAGDAALFRAQMLTEMAKMSAEDGMVMQIHPGSFRNHNARVFNEFGRDKGFDIPTRTDYVHALRPLLNAVGMHPNFTLILFTLDEAAYTRELAPLAGAYPCLRLGPAWWFHDSAEGMRRFREMTTETAGFYNTVGFNDDTRAFPSIPARHDMARRVDCAYLARLVADGQLREPEAFELARVLTVDLPRKAYRL
ncbi:glucuronate isomerase [Roseobacter sp. HKCCD9010]|uniref:glucuronate isomerase n=1 Tax=unclassified Roseobacter TaxID=196798 RepID=UPI001490F187|nr:MULTISPECIES: glucuronate isomerase [unclassified Roseobacter]MBF9049079.1 glucuronate isomerase [Rhodobacterales bacterium HKCCD4356]NNV11079.1 glucuronate isomerase [Roseobacter sp. HKCCD7357]NNV15263.1 glucuronate isomerase [Roseobacter sp. HKCCD8768]NNV24723.1 glucuronate isomerase [Roseobacter sp. HKCCD8192]NNV28979.1 glucuronate isomerase [Roseobacter sp. HKCCD9061]